MHLLLSLDLNRGCYLRLITVLALLGTTPRPLHLHLHVGSNLIVRVLRGILGRHTTVIFLIFDFAGTHQFLLL